MRFRSVESKLNIQLATIDEDGYPNIQPTWFPYGKAPSKLYTGTQKGTKNVQHILRAPDKIYFSIDDENFPYKGVKGRGDATISEDIEKNVAVMEKINMKYLCTLEHPLAKMLMDNARKRH